MREIKFRAWDDIKETMMSGVSLYWNREEFVVGIWNFEETHIVDGETKAILMQYTGLKDKNGVEIYESDIIKSTSYDAYEVKWVEFIGEENFGDGIGYAGWNIDLCSGYPPVKQELEVIGNIYENKEVLA